MEIKVKDLLPNPYRNIETYPIDRAKVEQLRNSIRETSFWDNVLARPKPGHTEWIKRVDDGEELDEMNAPRYLGVTYDKDGNWEGYTEPIFEVAYGHHRLVAIKEELGKDTVIDIPIRDLSDEDMLRIMANENMQEWSTDWRIIVETVKQAKDFLEKYTDIARKYRGRYAEEVGAPAISRFLGKNWPQGRITNALGVMKDQKIMLTLFERSDTNKIGLTILSRISSIQDEEVKKEWIEQVAKKDITMHEMAEIAHFENESVLSKHDKQIIRKKILEGKTRGKEQISREVKIKELLSQPRKEIYVSIPEGKYRTITIDPPWPIDKILREVRPNQIELDYSTMTLEEIETLPIPKLAYRDGCHVYLWTTHKYLPIAFKILEAWGASYECLLTWVKNVGITPFSWMYSTEHCLFARIGNLPLLKLGKRLDFQAKVREHSRKPDEFYNLVKEVSPEPRIDMFSREKREGFGQYGNEIDKFESEKVAVVS